jgi:hypothetical protein
MERLLMLVASYMQFIILSSVKSKRNALSYGSCRHEGETGGSETCASLEQCTEGTVFTQHPWMLAEHLKLLPHVILYLT